VQRVPLLSGTKLAIVNAGDNDVVLRPPPPGEPIDDVGAAVRDALASAGPRATLCVLPQGPQTIPYLAQEEATA